MSLQTYSYHNEYEFYKNENFKLRTELEQLKQSKIDPNDVANLVELANEMIKILESCRNFQLPYDIAKRIDNILAEAKNLD